MHENPILQKSKNIVLYSLFWAIVAAVDIALLSIGESIHFKSAMADGIVYNLLLGAFGLSTWYSAKYISFDANNLYKILFTHILGGILFTALWLLTGYYFINSFINTTEIYTEFFVNTLIWRFFIGILFYFLMTSFYYVIIYYSGFQERINRESELKNLVTQAELKSLKFQINPHFIFNSLNSMSALTTINPEKAREMILKLADFLRYTLANNEKQKNLLREELKNIKLYLDIEKIRFEDKFEFVEEVNDACLEVLVPNMILQPLFENAIKHAVYETLDKVTLILKCGSENEFLKISLENNFDTVSSIKPGAGVGLQNIKNRLKLIYNMDNLLDIKKSEKCFKVTMFIPTENKSI